jgi:glucose-1-phosphate thymidylyltransferase
VCLILGDNILFGRELIRLVEHAAATVDGATVFGYRVDDPEQYGVIEMDALGRVLSIEKKPTTPKANVALVGLYFSDSQVVWIAKRLQPSGPGELEMTDVNKEYLRRGTLKADIIGRGLAWLDTGTVDSLANTPVIAGMIAGRKRLKSTVLRELPAARGLLETASFANGLYGYRSQATAHICCRYSNQPGEVEAQLGELRSPRAGCWKCTSAVTGSFA